MRIYFNVVQYLCVFVLFANVLFPQEAWAQEEPQVGFYKGTFDPPHQGHRNAILTAIAQLGLDRIYVVPGVNQTHKPNANSYEVRRAMSELAFADIPQVIFLEPNQVEALREGGDSGLMQKLSVDHSEAQLFQIMGTDSFERIQELNVPPVPENFSIVVNERGKVSPLPVHYKGRKVIGIRGEHADKDYSSTKIRKEIAQGQVPEELDEKVYGMIESHGLYGASLRCVQLLAN